MLTKWYWKIKQILKFSNKSRNNKQEAFTFDEYSRAAMSAAIHLDKSDLIYPTLGLCGESGEVAEKVKKVLRDKNGVFLDEDKKNIIFEIGDALWYINRLAWGLGYSLEDVAKMNLAKLADRAKRSVIKGNGDRR